MPGYSKILRQDQFRTSAAKIHNCDSGRHAAFASQFTGCPVKGQHCLSITFDSMYYQPGLITDRREKLILIGSPANCFCSDCKNRMCTILFGQGFKLVQDGNRLITFLSRNLTIYIHTLTDTYQGLISGKYIQTHWSAACNDHTDCITSNIDSGAYRRVLHLHQRTSTPSMQKYLCCDWIIKLLCLTVSCKDYNIAVVVSHGWLLLSNSFKV